MSDLSNDRPELADERHDILRFYPRTKALISFVLRMNREPIRNPARSVANVEFHQTGDRVNETAHRIVAALEASRHSRDQSGNGVSDGDGESAAASSGSCHTSR